MSAKAPRLGEAKNRQGIGRVRWNGTEWLPSVTTVCNHLQGSAEGLVVWSLNLTSEVALDYVNKRLGEPDRVYELDPDIDLQRIRGLAHYEREWPAKRGTLVHKACELVITEGLDDMALALKFDGEVLQYVAGFRRWLEDFKPVFEFTELDVIGADPPVVGQADAGVRIGGKRILVDYKSAKSLKADYFVQISAYASADRGVTDDGEIIELGDFDEVAVLMLRPDGTYGWHSQPIDPADLDAYRLALELSDRITDPKQLPAAQRPPQKETPAVNEEQKARLSGNARLANAAQRTDTYERVKALEPDARDKLRSDHDIAESAYWADMTQGELTKLMASLDGIEGFDQGLAKVIEAIPGTEVVEPLEEQEARAIEADAVTAKEEATSAPVDNVVELRPETNLDELAAAMTGTVIVDQPGEGKVIIDIKALSVLADRMHELATAFADLASA